jgi:hypothetical protein
MVSGVTLIAQPQSVARVPQIQTLGLKMLGVENMMSLPRRARRFTVRVLADALFLCRLTEKLTREDLRARELRQWS